MFMLSHRITWCNPSFLILHHRCAEVSYFTFSIYSILLAAQSLFTFDGHYSRPLLDESAGMVLRWVSFLFLANYDDVTYFWGSSNDGSLVLRRQLDPTTRFEFRRVEKRRRLSTMQETKEYVWDMVSMTSHNILKPNYSLQRSGENTMSFVLVPWDSPMGPPQGPNQQQTNLDWA